MRKGALALDESARRVAHPSQPAGRIQCFPTQVAAPLIQVTDIAHFPAKLRSQGTAVTIGNFDGCHLGHRRLVDATLDLAAKVRGTAVAMSFLPRPEAFFRGQLDEPLLFTSEQKTRALGELGLGWQVVEAFDEPFSRIAHEVFYDQHLRGALGAKALVIGDNFRFGHSRRGDSAYLASRAKADGVELKIGDDVSYVDRRISSTRVRETLCREGAVDAVAAMLGRPYLVEGVIRRGDQLGRQLGTPTANLEEIHQLLPRYGIYAGYVWLAANPTDQSRPPVMQRSPQALPAVFSIGVRPTLKANHAPLRVEAYVLDRAFGDDELYDRRAGFYFSHRLRDEAELKNLDELKAWIARDILNARRLLGLL